MKETQKARCTKSDATELCKACDHNGEHDEVIDPRVKVAPGAYRVCSEGGSCRCIPVASDPVGQGKLF